MESKKFCPPTCPNRKPDETAKSRSNTKKSPEFETNKDKVQTLIKENKVVVFGKAYCPYCMEVQKILDNNDIEYHMVMLDRENEGHVMQEELTTRTSSTVVPYIFINGVHVGGLAELMESVTTGTLNNLLNGIGVSQLQFDLIVIGGGSAGIAAAKEAAKFGKNVALISYSKPTQHGNRWVLGGRAVNVGELPRKLLYRASLFKDDFKDAQFYGWAPSNDTTTTDPADTEKPPKMEHTWNGLVGSIKNYIQRVSWRLKKEQREMGVTLYENWRPEFVDLNTMTLYHDNGKMDRITGRVFVIATGTRAITMDVLGAEESITPDELFYVEGKPERVLVIGKGNDALEIATALNGLGSETTILTKNKPLGNGLDNDIAEKIKTVMEARGIRFLEDDIALTKLCPVENTEGGVRKVEGVITNVQPKESTEDKRAKPETKGDGEVSEGGEEKQDEKPTEENEEKPEETQEKSKEKQEKPGKREKSEEKQEKPGKREKSEEKQEKPGKREKSEEKQEKPGKRDKPEEKEEKTGNKREKSEEKQEKKREKSEEKQEKPKEKQEIPGGKDVSEGNNKEETNEKIEEQTNETQETKDNTEKVEGTTTDKEGKDDAGQGDANAENVLVTDTSKRTFCETDDFFEEFDLVIYVGTRWPNIEGLGLLNLPKFRVSSNCKITVNERYQTSVPNIFAVGSVADRRGWPASASLSSHSGKSLVQRFYSFSTGPRMPFKCAPTRVLTPIEYAFLGVTEDAAKKLYGAIKTFHNIFTTEESGLSNRFDCRSYVKVICTKVPAVGHKVVGLHLLCPNASEMIQGFVVGYQRETLTKEDLDKMIAVHPIAAEIFTNLTVVKESDEEIGLQPF